MSKENKKMSKEEKKNSKDLVVKKEKPYKERKGKWLRQTSLTVLLILIIIAACIGLNIFVEEKNFADIDVTQDKIYSLSDMTKSIVSSVDKDVEILIINPDIFNDMLGTNYNGIVDVSRKYNSINKKITVEVIDDITSRPDITDEYGITADSCAVILKCGENEKILSIYDLYTTDYTTGQLKNQSEEALTNAIISLTTDEKPVIYNLTGHNKYSSDYLYYFSADLEEEAYEFEDLDLLTTGEVPEDCSVLMITTLSEDITVAERDAILKYIDKGGKIILFTDPNTTGKEMPNFQAILDEYGVGISEGVMLEQDSDKMLYGTASAIIVTVSPYTSVTSGTNMNMNACFMSPGRIDIADSEELEELGVEVETLATTSENSFYRTNYSITSGSKTDDDEDAPNETVGALLKKKINDDTTSELIMYSNNVFVTNLQIQLNIQAYSYALDFYNNEDLAMNSIAYLTARDNMITIRKDAEITTYTITEQQNIIILTIIFAIPIMIIIIGIIVWQVRRRKK